ncbi:MAG TPA: glycosyltransferase family 9 protein [Caulobacterales bacterium]|nr:glycosyltransferase family 9 protein [Caulobacterales bacterium]
MIFKKKTQAKPAPSAAKRVLVIKMGGLADFVQMLAAAKRIRDYHVGARITLLTNEPFRVMAEKCPYFDTVESDASVRPPTVGESATTAVGAQAAKEEQPIIVQLISRVRAAKYDMVYDLENSRRTNAIYQGLRPWPPLWSGGAPGCSHPFKDPGALHNLDRLAAQLQSAGIEVAGPLVPDFAWVRVALRDPPRLQPDYFGIRGRYVLLCPRGGDVGAKRRWPVEKYVQLANRIAAQGVTPVVLGGQEEREVGAAIAQAERRAKNLVMRPDLFQSAALAERASFAVGDDVDLLHVAAAGGAPSLVFMSSRADVEAKAPRGPGGVVGLTAAIIADIPVDQVDRQIRNCGVYIQAATA